MTGEMPRKLAKSPLLEAVFELQFEPATAAAGDLLPGLLYSEMKEQYAEVAPLPMASVPRVMRDQSPDLKYQASHRLRSGPNSVQVGDRVVSLSSTDYPGWNRFSEMVESLLGNVRKTGLVKKAHRFSFKYINVIAVREHESQLSLLNARIELTGAPPPEKGFLLRVERDEDRFTTIIQLATNTTAKQAATGAQIFGLLVDIDTLRLQLGDDFLGSPSILLKEGHLVAKRAFFSLLTESGLKRMEPEW